MRFPERIVCLTEETTETLYLIGEGDRIVGVSGYTVRPPEARQKPRVSAFINARFDKIEALRPDLILAFSDLQADIAAELIRRGYTVVTFNQRSVAEILQMIVIVGSLVGRIDRAEALVAELSSGLNEIRAAAAQAAAAAARLLRGVGCADHLGHLLGGRIDRDCRRSADLPRAAVRISREASDR